MPRDITRWLALVAAIQALSMLPAVGGDAAQDSGNTVESRVFWTGNASLVFDRVIIWKIADY